MFSIEAQDLRNALDIVDALRRDGRYPTIKISRYRISVTHYNSTPSPIMDVECETQITYTFLTREGMSSQERKRIAAKRS